MLNLTARLAVSIRYLPDWDVDWLDSQPQRSRQSLTISHFLPTEEDVQELQARAVQYMMKFLVAEFLVAPLRNSMISQRLAGKS